MQESSRAGVATSHASHAALASSSGLKLRWRRILCRGEHGCQVNVSVRSSGACGRELGYALAWRVLVANAANTRTPPTAAAGGTARRDGGDGVRSPPCLRRQREYSGHVGARERHGWALHRCHRYCQLSAGAGPPKLQRGHYVARGPPVAMLSPTRCHSDLAGYDEGGRRSRIAHRSARTSHDHDCCSAGAEFNACRMDGIEAGMAPVRAH